MEQINTDSFEFGKHKLFKHLEKSLPDKFNTQNIIECKDDILFAWDSSEYCVLSLNWRAANAQIDSQLNYQVRIFIFTRTF